MEMLDTSRLNILDTSWILYVFICLFGVFRYRCRAVNFDLCSALMVIEQCMKVL